MFCLTNESAYDCLTRSAPACITESETSNRMMTLHLSFPTQGGPMLPHALPLPSFLKICSSYHFPLMFPLLLYFLPVSPFRNESKGKAGRYQGLSTTYFLKILPFPSFLPLTFLSCSFLPSFFSASFTRRIRE